MTELEPKLYHWNGLNIRTATIKPLEENTRKTSDRDPGSKVLDMTPKHKPRKQSQSTGHIELGVSAQQRQQSAEPKAPTEQKQNTRTHTSSVGWMPRTWRAHTIQQLKTNLVENWARNRFFQRWQRDGREVHKKVLSPTNHQGDTHQNNNVTSSWVKCCWQKDTR